MKLSERVKKIEPSPTLAISSLAKKMKSEGKDVLGFGSGEPDFDTPLVIKNKIKEALEKGLTKYTPASGTIGLKKLICEKLKKDNGLEYSPSQVVVSCGAKHSLFNVIMSVVDSGDEVLIPSPYWVSYPEMVKIAGGVPVFVTCSEENGYKLEIEKLKNQITKKTKAIILNSPCNPTGAVYNREELEQIARLCTEKGVLIISDEIYEKIIYKPAKHYSIALFGSDVNDNTVVINGFSKAYSMTGLRIGYMAGPKSIVDAVSKLQSHSTSNPTSIIMFGLEGAFWIDEEIEKMRKEFEKRRNYIVDRLNSIPGIECSKPDGAFYVFPNISGIGMTSFEFAEKLLNEKWVAVVPGGAFGADENIRISYATDMETIEKGMDRIEEFVKSL